MDNNYKKTFLFFLLFFFFLIKADFVLALEQQYPPIFGLSIGSGTLPEYARYFFNIGIAIAGILAVIVIAFGGIYYLVSLGRGQFTDEGRQWIKAGILGLILTVSSYLIVYTINPNLVVFNFNELLPLPFNNFFQKPPPNTTPFVYYNEIPLGTLTENTLSRTMDCYDFDSNGDPIESQIEVEINDNRQIINGPTLLNHDRVDCFLKLTKAAEKKSKLIKKLSDEIVKLMEQCSCEGKCNTTCDINNPGACFLPDTAQTDINKKCTLGRCVGAACKPLSTPGTGSSNDCCPTDSGIRNSETGRNFTVKEIIEHGPIKIGNPLPQEKTITFYTTYAHMDKIYASIGDRIIRGDVIGEVGGVNTNTGAHIHFAAGLQDPMWIDSISFNIYSSISAPGGSTGNRAAGVSGPMPIPNAYTPANLNYILSSLGAPVSLGYCNWKEVFGSLLHSGYAYWAQDWYCPTQAITEKAKVTAMAGNQDIKSTVVAIDPNVGNVVIEHKFTVAITSTPIELKKEFKGLDEFRTQLTNVSDFIETNNPKPKIDGREIAIIKNGNCRICDNACLQCNSDDSSCLAQCEEANTACQEERETCLQNSPWSNLKLIEQLMYFKEKMNEIKTSVEKDRSQLQSAEGALGQCYLAEPYIDFLKTVEKTKKEDKVVMALKTFNDPETQKPIDIYKYCKGFDYANSNAYTKCQNICPETLEDKTCYRAVPECDEENPQNQANCLIEQTARMKICYDNRKCPANTSPFATFKDCIQKFNQQCLALCDKKYPSEPSDELEKCKIKCGGSKCLLENEGNCVVNFPQLKTCTDKYSDPDNLKNCMDNSFLCKYGSDQYAGYPDCAKNQGQYSSSYLYQNPDKQKCRYPYRLYTYSNGVNSGQTCLNLYPETAKCPSASMCPKCPCGIINETINYDSGESGGGGGSGGGGNGSNGGNGEELSTKILGYQIATGACNESSYNDDPLTFYCQQNWWNKEIKTEEKNPIPIGKEKICSKEKEIPVGQTIDDAEKWADELIKNIDNFTKTTGEMIQYVKSIIQEQNYCQCDSACEEGRPCSFSCRYFPETDTADASCTPVLCAGISCQKMINLLRGGATKNCKAAKNGIFYYYDRIYKESKTFYKFAILDGRTDIVKKLSYSRKKMNEAGTAQSAFDREIKILSCERVQDEIISPIKEGKVRVENKTIESYCYGKILGKILKTPEPLADNWFYCEQRQGINE